MTDTIKPVAHLYVGDTYGGELQDWEIDPEQGLCEDLNIAHVNNPTRLPLYTQAAIDAAVAAERAEIATLRRQVAAAKVVIAGQDDRAKLLGAEFSALCAQAADVAGEREANAILTDEIDRLRAALRQALAALETCTPADYSTGHVIHADYDEKLCAAAEVAARAALGE